MKRSMMKYFEQEDSNESLLNAFDANTARQNGFKSDVTHEDFRNDMVFFQNENEINLYKSIASKKKRKKERRQRVNDPTRPIVNRKIVNLPASQPYIRTIDGEERLCFKYNTKVSETAMNAMPRAELEDNEFCVRFDIETVDVSKISEKFKADNVIYPRANIPKESYTGNRWIYETECNKLAWQFVTLNHVLLYGKKGLIQRAVDSYRKFNKQSRNKKYRGDDSSEDDTSRRKRSESSYASLMISFTSKGIQRKCKVRIDVENVNLEKLDEEFKSKYAVFFVEFDEDSFGLENWDNSNTENDLAIKIAYLNLDNAAFWNAVKLTGKNYMLKKAVEAYMNKDNVKSDEMAENNEEENAAENSINIMKDDDDLEDLFLFENSREIEMD